MRQALSLVPLLPLALSLVAGLAVGFLVVGAPSGLFVLGAGLVLAVLCYKWPRLQGCCVLVSVLGLGIALAQRADSRRPSVQREGLMEAVVVSEVQPKTRSVALDIVLTATGERLKCYLQKDERSRRLAPGYGLRLLTRIVPTTELKAGSFDYGAYLWRHGYAGQCYASASQWQTCRLSMASLPLLERSRVRLLGWRHRLLEHYRRAGIADSDHYAVLAAMTLGDKSALSDELLSLYSLTGAAHVLALSGLHLGILYMLFTLLTLGWGRRSRWLQVLLVAAVWAYVMLVGMPVSVVRAALMLSCFSFFAIAGRRGASVNTLSLAALLILLVSPHALLDVGFQLSFFSVLSILLVMPLLRGTMGDDERPAGLMRRVAVAVFGVSLAAQAGTAPLVAYYFGRFATYSLLNNLVVLPSAYVILGTALVMLLLPLPGVAALTGQVIGFMHRGLTLISALPMASVEGLRPSVSQVVVCYVVEGLVLAALYVLAKGRAIQAEP